jgi:hypothetical protein
VEKSASEPFPTGRSGVSGTVGLQLGGYMTSPSCLQTFDDRRTREAGRWSRLREAVLLPLDMVMTGRPFIPTETGMR